MFNYDELFALMVALGASSPCELHGREHLRICESCLIVQCSECEPRACQCQNDE